MNTNWRICITDLRLTGLSLGQIGEAIGLSPQALSDIEQGRSKEPRGMAAVRLYQLHAALPKPDSGDESNTSEAA